MMSSFTIMAQQKFVLGVDLDGVCADFYDGLREIAAEWLGVPLETLTRDVTYGLPEWKLDRCGKYDDLHRFAVVERDLFRNLKPIHGAPAVLRRIAHQQGIRIRIITHRLFIPHFHQTAIDQTVQWLDHYGIPYWDLCFMRDKAAVGADLYIEDSPSNVVALRADNHPTVVFSNSTNREVEGPRADTWEQVETIVVEQVQEWQGRAAMRHTLAT
jgi:5'(3')-deoxyribonucleotidase